MNNDGKISAVRVYGRSGRKWTELIDLLRDIFRRDAAAGKIRACAVVYDIGTVPPGKTQKTDAIAVEMDHRGGMSITVVYPYAIAADKEVTLGESYEVKGQDKIFVTRPARR